MHPIPELKRVKVYKACLIDFLTLYFFACGIGRRLLEIYDIQLAVISDKYRL